MLTTVQTMYHYFAARLGQERGATAIEYGLMVALIGMVIAATVYAAGGALKDLYDGVILELKKWP